MKKLITILLMGTFAMSVIFSGCSSATNTEQPTTEADTTVKATQAPTTEEPTTEEPTTEEPTTEEPTTEVTTTEEPTTEKPTELKTETEPEANIEIISVTSSVEAGSNASISIKGKPNTKYSISVVYHSSASKADGLETKTSDENGNVTWTWKVGARTAKDTYNITISGGDQTIKTQFTVV